MTSSNGNNSNRLDRIESILESVIQRTDSNARTIQGILDARTEERLEHEERMEVMSDAIQRLIRVEEGLVNMVANVDENQPTMLRKLMAIEKQRDRAVRPSGLEASPRVDSLLKRNQ